MARLTLNAINAELARRGKAERLVKGKGYFYFIDGEADHWYCASVYTAQLRNLTLDQWCHQLEMLRTDYLRPGSGPDNRD